ncbi:unnamed protein product [Effrenium voratum]|uniref:MACPF domain-containing protein n=1 Tax=Effrenium voratum TaxID=2562239 RepID=A0AA36NIY3_9DINO|nr:unnamed protein product [Effrenium voratum]CAJ1454817.1 unnamed protein product [Effrenium voratum]
MIAMWRCVFSQLVLSCLVFLPLRNADGLADCEDLVAMQMRLEKTTITTTTTMSAPAHTVKFTSKGGELWAFVAKTFSEARTEATNQLRMKGWLNAHAQCELCCASAPQNFTCCFQFFWVGSALSQEAEDGLQGNVPDVGTSLEVVFKAEENLDSDVVKVVRNSGLSAEQQHTSLQNLQERGISSSSQLIRENPKDIFGGSVSRMALNKLTQAQTSAESQQVAAAKASLIPSAADEAAKVQAMTAGMAAKLAQARQEMEQVVANGQGHVTAQAEQQMNNVLAQLRAISVDDADLSTDSALTSLNTAIASGGFVGGSKLLPSQLISFNGVFRGIALMIGGELRGQAVEFRSSYAQMPQDQLMQLYEMHPEVNSQEMYLESEFASDLQYANGMVEAYGQSAFSASVDSWQAGFDVASSGFSGGGSGGQSSSKSGGSAHSRHNSESEKMKKKITSLYKSQYFFEPKMTLAISEDMLQLSQQFRARCDAASYSLCKSMDLENCNQWLATPEVTPQNPTNKTNKTETEMSLGLTAILTNVNWNAFANNPIQSAFEDAARNYFVSMAGVEGVDVQVSTARPGAYWGGDKWTQVLLQISVAPASFSVNSNIMKWWNKGVLQSGMLSAVEAARGMSDARVENQTDPSHYLPRTWRYFVTSWQPAEPSKAVSQFQVYEPDVRALLDPTSSAEQLVLSLIYDYGTHICPKVTLGAWWRITARYVSTVDQERLDVEQAATSYITKAEAESWAYDASAAGSYRGVSGGASAGQGSSGGKGKGSNSTSGAKEETLIAMKNATMNVEQVWQGGAEGVSPLDWRRSLDENFNSNWKVIERDLTRCVGLWMYVEDPYLSQALCSTWVSKLLQSYNLTSDSVPLQLQTAACTTTRNMQYLINFAQNVSAAMQEQEYASLASECVLKHPGNYWSPPNTCIPKQCFCTLKGGTVANGTTGKDCPQQGDRDCVGCCLESQRGTCSKPTACASGDILKPKANTLKCQ